jgi:hypothetical protein
MSLASAIVMDGNLARPQGQGDVLNTSEVVQALTTAGAGTVTAQMLASNVINRTGPGGAVADTLPTAAQLINQLLPTVVMLALVLLLLLVFKLVLLGVLSTLTTLRLL